MKNSSPHVLFILPYPGEGGSTRFRVEQYLGHLREAKIGYTLSSFYSPGQFRIMRSPGRMPLKGLYFLHGCLRRLRDLWRCRKADVVFVHREAFPFGPPVFENWFSRGGRRLIYDLDDAIYLPKERPLYPWLTRLRNPAKTGRIAGMAALTFSGNEVLTDYVRKFTDAITILPTPIDTDLFCPPENPRQNPRPIIGWMGNVTGVPYLNELRGAFLRLAKRFDFEVFVVGGKWECPGIHVRSKPWELGTEVEEMQSFDIGVMPLPDSKWTRGKCSFKLIQYMSCGIPAVASPVGMNREVIQDGENGFLATTEDEWVEKMARLLENRDLRACFGKRGRERVEREYSVKALGPRFVEEIEKAIGKR